MIGWSWFGDLVGRIWPSWAEDLVAFGDFAGMDIWFGWVGDLVGGLEMRFGWRFSFVRDLAGLDICLV